MFTDRVIIDMRAGKGGNGVVAWRREKYLPKGGPYGGDGGKGASIVLVADNQIYSLEAYRNRRIVKADNGVQGGSNNRRGKNGKDLVLKIPCGTLVKRKDSGEILYDFTEDGEKWVICQGGRGGWGNTHFKSPTNRAPMESTPGAKGKSIEVELELKLIADVGLVGFPNAGKSTLISQVTDVPVKIAPYPFTTLRPNLGYVMGEYGERILIADIPGIIAGAHQNRGLGLEFLRHIERTHMLLFVIDVSGMEERSPLEDFKILLEEVRLYNPELLKKPYAVLLNKIDLESADGYIPHFHEEYSQCEIFEISALSGQGLEGVMGFLKRKLKR